MQQATRWFQELMADALTHDWVWRILVAIGIALVGMWLARSLSQLIDRVMLRLSVEDILRRFLRNVAYAIALVIVFIAALDFAGVPTTSLLAVVGAAGLAIGLALKDSLSNIASGVMLIVLRPFHAGDVVQIAGREGIVDSVRIFQTHIHTVDNLEIILPNSEITSAPIINYTGRGERRIDVSLPVAFGDDVAAAREGLLALARANPRVHASPAPEVLVTAIGESTVTLQLRAWSASRDHGPVQAELMESLLADYARRGIRAPLPRREVHVFHHDKPGGLPPDALDEAVKPAL